MDLNIRTRHLWAEKIVDLAHFAAGAFFFAQFYSEKDFSWPLAILGILFLIIGYWLSLILLRRR